MHYTLNTQKKGYKVTRVNDSYGKKQVISLLMSS